MAMREYVVRGHKLLELGKLTIKFSTRRDSNPPICVALTNKKNNIKKTGKNGQKVLMRRESTVLQLLYGLGFTVVPGGSRFWHTF